MQAKHLLFALSFTLLLTFAASYTTFLIHREHDFLWKNLEFKSMLITPEEEVINQYDDFGSAFMKDANNGIQQRAILFIKPKVYFVAKIAFAIGILLSIPYLIKQQKKSKLADKQRIDEVRRKGRLKKQHKQNLADGNICPVCAHASSKAAVICENCGLNIQQHSDTVKKEKELEKEFAEKVAEGNVCPACQHPNPKEVSICEDCELNLS